MAPKIHRVRKGYRCAMAVVLFMGCFTTFVLFVFPEPIFRIFITEKELLPMGVDYLKILAVSQLFMCMESRQPALSTDWAVPSPCCKGILLTAARIPPCTFATRPSWTEWDMVGDHYFQHTKDVVLFTWFLLYEKTSIHSLAMTISTFLMVHQFFSQFSHFTRPSSSGISLQITPLPVGSLLPHLSSQLLIHSPSPHP